MEKILLPDRAYFAIAKEADETQGAEALLDHLSIVVGPAEQKFAASVATTKASAINRAVAQFSAGARQEFLEIFGGGCRRLPLELHSLAHARQGTHSDAARARIGAEQISDEKVSTVEFFEVLIHDQANKKISARFSLIIRRQGIKGFRQDLVSRAVADFVDDILLDLSQGPGIADGRAALRCQAVERNLPADRQSYPALLENLTVQIDLGQLLAKVAARQAAQDRQRRVSFVPGFKPGLAVEMERIDERQPAISLARLQTGLQPPISRAVGFLDLFLGKMKRLQIGAGQSIETESQAPGLFEFLVADDKALARTTRQHRNACVDLKDFEDLPRLREETRGHKHQAKRGLGRRQLFAQMFGPLLQTCFIEAA